VVEVSSSCGAEKNSAACCPNARLSTDSILTSASPPLPLQPVSASSCDLPPLLTASSLLSSQ